MKSLLDLPLWFVEPRLACYISYLYLLLQVPLQDSDEFVGLPLFDCIGVPKYYN